jgi:hypothetical protein
LTKPAEFAVGNRRAVDPEAVDPDAGQPEDGPDAALRALERTLVEGDWPLLPEWAVEVSSEIGYTYDNSGSVLLVSGVLRLCRSASLGLRLHYHTGVSRGGAAQPPASRGGRWLLLTFLQPPAALW